MPDLRRTVPPQPAGPMHGRVTSCVAAMLGVVLLLALPPAETRPTDTARPAAPTTGPDEAAANRLETAVALLDTRLAAAPADHVGMAVLDTATGELTLGAEARRPFASASLAKLITVVAILHRAETGSVTLTASLRGLLRRALSVSDDRAMDTLWSRFGGPGTITEVMALAGLRDTRPPTDPAWWGRTQVSARDVVTVYRYMANELSPAGQDLVLSALTSAPDVAADGFDQAFGLLRAPRVVGVATKQGWMLDGGSLYLHSAGQIGRWVVALLSERPAGEGADHARAELSDTATTVLAALPKYGRATRTAQGPRPI